MLRYVPSVALQWAERAGGRRHLQVEGSLVFADISGFTNLAEKLTARGRIGAEELTAVLDRVFGQMLDIVDERGGSMIKFGGDALLLLFEGDTHAIQATAAAVEMRTALRNASRQPTSVGLVNLKMSSGVHTGLVDFFLVGSTHSELIITGPAASTTTELEATAGAGEIVVSPETRALLPRDFIGPAKGSGWLVRKRMVSISPSGEGQRPATGSDLARLIPEGLRDHLAAGMVESEHRIANVGFVKFKGVDSLLAEAGPDRVATELDGFIRGIQTAVSDEDVTFLASDIDKDGGKVILATGVPIGRHDDEGRILRALRRIVDTPCSFAVQAGVNRGHVFAGNVGGRRRSTFTVMGDTVNLAARLVAKAGPGMLYASPSVLDLSASMFRTEGLEPFTVKGKEELIRAYTVFEETGVKPPEAKNELPFHGREAELQAIVGIVTTCAQSGRGGMLTISGDTGVGKSRLINEVLDRCPEMAVGRIQAEPYGTDNPYWALRDPLRRLFGVSGGSRENLTRSLRGRVARLAPDLGWAVPLLGDLMHIPVPDNEETAAIDPRFRPARTSDVLVQLLEAAFDGPMALVAEDGQWLDEATTDLLRRLGEAAETRPWTVILTARNDGGAFTPLGTEVALMPLDDREVRAIAAEATASAPLRPHELDAIVARAGGNPLFLSEVLEVVRETGSAEHIPDSLDAVVSKQIDTLLPLARQVLRHLSVLGRSFRSDVMERFLAEDGLEPDGPTRQDLMRFLESDGSARVSFRHAVVQAVAYGGLPYRRRRDLHARAGEVIEDMAGVDLEDAAEVLALHFSESGGHVKAWHHSRVAGDKAKRTYSNAEAATHYRRAVDSARNLDVVDPAELADVWTRLGEVRDLMGQYEAARDAFGRAARLLEGDAVRVAELHLRQAEAWFGSGNLTQAKRSLTKGRRLLDGAGGRDAMALLARLDAYESGVHISSGHPAKALSAARMAISRAESTGEDQARAQALSTADWANFMLGRDETRRGEDAIEIFDRIGQSDRSAMTMNMMGAFAYLEGDWGRAIDWYTRSVQAAETSGNTYHAASTRANIAELMVSQRRFADAIPLLDEAGRFFEASRSKIIKPFVDLQRARALIGMGSNEEALPELERLFSAQLGSGDTYAWPETALALAEALVGTGQTAEAQWRLNEFTAAAPESASRLTAGIERVRALAALSDGHIQAAIDYAESGLARSVEEGDLYAELLLAETLVESLLRADRHPSPALGSRIAQLVSLLGVDTQVPVT